MGEVAAVLHPVPGRAPATTSNQFRDTKHQVIVWPAEYKTGNMIYPYQDAKKK